MRDRARRHQRCVMLMIVTGADLDLEPSTSATSTPAARYSFS
jgi:hypothetical protein